MGVQKISGKDVRNMKAHSLIKRGPASSSQQIQHLRGGTEKNGGGWRGVQGGPGVSRGGPGGSRGGPGGPEVGRKNG